MLTACGRKTPIDGTGNLSTTLRSSEGGVSLLLRDVGHAPHLRYHLLSLCEIPDNNHEYVGRKLGVSINRKSGSSSFLPSVGRLNYTRHRGQLEHDGMRDMERRFLAPSVTPAITRSRTQGERGDVSNK